MGRTQRKRIAEAARKMPRNCQALVTRSRLVRSIMTAIRWFSPTHDDGGRFEAFAT